jgi:hypothetical protein
MDEVAVVTDALSEDYFLPAWAKYYGSQFGRENLYVFTYNDKTISSEIGVGNALRMSFGYDNNVRIRMFNDFVARLLQSYACVIRADVDEFLVPDPRLYDGLKAFVMEARGPYATALGLDVVEMADEPPLNFKAPLLSQRKFAVKASAYSKTCVVRQPVSWGLGFHTMNARPVFGELYLFHLKFADASRRLDWFEFMAETCRSDEAHYRHFKAARQQFETTLAHFRDLPRREGDAAIRDRAFVATMEAAAAQGEDGQFDFQGIATTDSVLCEIPGEFARF